MQIYFEYAAYSAFYSCFVLPINIQLSVTLQVACMQFINIVVHSVEDMNFRVHLQYDFTKLCLDEYLDVSVYYDGGIKAMLI